MKGLHSSLIPRLMIAAVISLIVTLWCWWATGPGLGLFLGTTLLVSIFLPALALSADGIGRIVAPAGATAVIALVWVTATQWSDVTIPEWFRCAMVLAGFSWAIAGVVSLLAAMRISKPHAAGLTVVLALLWLTWPVWLSHAMTQPRVDWLVPAHPLFAINSVLKHLGTWDRAPLAYNTLTVLNQDVSYRLPASILPAVLIHFAIGTPGLWLALRDRRVKDTNLPTIVPPDASSAPPA